MEERLWSIKDVSQFLGVPVNTLYYWRYTGRGPRAYRAGRWLKYREAEVRSWLERQAA